ncbi:MAG: thioredoxin [Cellulosilyticum sp.]|nr:thioredoxin [Cellulosilyticum sp.]
MAEVVKSNEFQGKINKGIVVVDFFATWCQPCSMLAPIFDELGQEMKGKAEFIKINVDDSMDVATKYEIMTIPAVLVFKDGEVQERMVGFLPKGEIKQKVEQYL